MKKRFLIFILSIAAVVSCAVSFSACDGGNPSESSNLPSYSVGDNLDVLTPEMEDELSGFYYTFTTGSCVITGVKDNKVKEIVIPDFVTGIGNSAFYHCSDLKSVVIGDGVTTIEAWAFSQCNNLKSVVIGESVTRIERMAFYSCDSLTSITFKDASTWHITYGYLEWEDKIGGTEMNVADPSTNADYYAGAYRFYYWYKL